MLSVDIGKLHARAGERVLRHAPCVYTGQATNDRCTLATPVRPVCLQPTGVAPPFINSVSDRTHLEIS